jgi:hypothetical protein
LSLLLCGTIELLVVSGSLTFLAAFATEEDESVLRSLDVIRIAFTWPAFLISDAARGLATLVDL